MRRLKQLILKLELDSLILVGNKYDDDAICEFEQDRNFLYLTELDIPNINILFIKGKIYCYFSKKVNYPFNNIVKLPKFIIILNKAKYDFLSSQIKNSIIDKHIEYEINKARTIKDKLEIAKIKRATQYTKKIIEIVNKNIHLCKTEIDLKNLVLKTNYNLEGYPLSFKPICSSGQNNKILHHKAKKQLIKNDSPIILDIGFRYKNYCSDITRILVKKKMKKKAQLLYNNLLNIQKKLISKIKPNISWDDLETLYFNELNEVLLEIKILKTRVPNVNILKKFMPHSIGHSIGLDTHDIEIDNILRKKMVIALEPGIYFSKSLLRLDNKIFNIKVLKFYINNVGGMRIEDIILVNDVSKIL